MPVTLRSPNNPRPDVTILTALAQIVPGYPTPNTRLAAQSVSQTGAEQVYVQRKYAMLAQAVFPAVLLQSGQQAYIRASWRNYDGEFQVYVDYYDDWVVTDRSFDQILADLAADLERIKANIESNDSLTVGNQALTVSIPKMSLSPYEGTLITVNSRPFVMRRLALSMLLLDYDV